MIDSIYKNSSYLQKNPGWHTEDSLWKAQQILKIIEQNKIKANTICEVGCGAGEILVNLQNELPAETELWGYDISPQAISLAQKNSNNKLHFKLTDILSEPNAKYDLLLLIDVIEHLEDYFTFLRQLKNKSKFKILHIPLDLSSQTVLRAKPLLKVRHDVGHLHYFTKNIAEQILKDCGYQIIDSFYTDWHSVLPAKSFISRLARLPRKILYKINADFAVRLLGGYSLLILVK